MPAGTSMVVIPPVAFADSTAARNVQVPTLPGEQSPAPSAVVLTTSAWSGLAGGVGAAPAGDATTTLAIRASANNGNSQRVFRLGVMATTSILIRPHGPTTDPRSEPL